MPSVRPLQHHAEAEVGRHRRRLQPRLLPGAVLEGADVLRQPAHRRHDQRPGQLGRRDRRADALGHGDAQPRAGLDVDVRADAAGLRDQLQLRAASRAAGAGTGVRSRISTSTSASRRRTESWPMPLTVLVKTLALRCSRLDRALELAHGILVVVEDDDVHGRATRIMRRVGRGLNGPLCTGSGQPLRSLFHLRKDSSMASHMHSASVPVFVRMLGNLRHAGSTRPRRMRRAKKFDPAVYLTRAAGARHAAAADADPDRLRRRQVLRGAPGRQSRRRRSRTTRRRLAELRERIAQDDRLPEVGAGGADRRQRREATSRCRAAPARSRCQGEAYLKHFALPNFFFHVTTTYALLRHNGVELGKIDFLGALPQAGAAA